MTLKQHRACLVHTRQLISSKQQVENIQSCTLVENKILVKAAFTSSYHDNVDAQKERIRY